MFGFNSGPWQVTETVYSYRKNLFSLAPKAEAHIATIISGSKRELARFDRNVALIESAPDFYLTLKNTLELLEDYGFVQNPRAQALARQIEALLARVHSCHRRR